MKHFNLVIALCVSTLLLGKTIAPQQIQNSIIYVSPGRGGTHLLRLILQHYTKRPFDRILTKPMCPFALRRVQILDIIPDTTKSPFYHTHIPEKCSMLDAETNQLILITRNPKELMISRAKRAIAKQKLTLNDEQTKQFIIEFILDKDNYQRPMEQLKAFDKWPEQKRFFVTYEDLLGNQQATIEKLMVFVGEDPSIVAPGLKKLAQRQKQSIELYNQTCQRSGGSLSEGKYIHFHSRDIPKDTLKAIDNMLEKNYPDLWRKYLCRYKELSS